MASRLAYLRRIAEVYARPSVGPLSFWHEKPEQTFSEDARRYHMRFRRKSEYAGPFDQKGVPLLDYRGDIGCQYNPIAIAQFGLAHFNRWCEDGNTKSHNSWLAASHWLATSSRPNQYGVQVWMHEFDWPYRQVLRAPWYSGLAQGNGISMLVRAAQATNDPDLAEAAHVAYQSFQESVDSGGVCFQDSRGYVWIEEYLVNPPSHILNGFIWAAWGVLDYARWSGASHAGDLWNQCVRTLGDNLAAYDCGWWSLYEISETEPMLASAYYHRLHIVQLRVMSALTGNNEFERWATRFERYGSSRLNASRAFVQKALFKLFHY